LYEALARVTPSAVIELNRRVELERAAALTANARERDLLLARAAALGRP
jgi:predicted RNA polymerase sigma factor